MYEHVESSETHQSTLIYQSISYYFKHAEQNLRRKAI